MCDLSLSAPVSLPLAGRRLVVSIRDAGTRMYDVSYYIDGVRRISHLSCDVWNVVSLAECLLCSIQLPAQSVNPDMYNRLRSLCIRYDIPTV